jgi:hypothetical protein
MHRLRTWVPQRWLALALLSVAFICLATGAMADDFFAI